jgi:hypothetical protein
MQMDFFMEATAPLPALSLIEHNSSDYGPRTGQNAREADVTVAFATDFSTAGERLTHKLAGSKYVGIPYGSDVASAASTLIGFLRKTGGKTLNVAGNGIYTLSADGITQSDADTWVFQVLRAVIAKVSLSHIRSGGQTGVDTAGLVAGLALGVPVTGLYPKGFKRRLANKRDVCSDAVALEAELRKQAALLR